MGLLDMVSGALGGQGGGGGQDALLKLVMGMLSDNGQGGGGLAGLLQQLQQAGLGEQVNSWVGTGQNLPVSPEQLQQAFGGDQMSQMAEKMGLSTGDL
ncbi:MAG: YidB family protein, partial [Proteobacteria bacterium]|nr:YidB family protein [Pseudomonadota bacterium]